jgi:prevent-host-death family protein
MGRIVSATEARINLGELMRHAVENRESIIVERRGEPYVVILSAEEHERLLTGMQKDSWRDLLRRAREQIQRDLGGQELQPPEEVLDELRKERDEQLLPLC